MVQMALLYRQSHVATYWRNLQKEPLKLSINNAKADSMRRSYERVKSPSAVGLVNDACPIRFKD